MKRNYLTLACLGAVTLAFSGCFSAAARFNEGWTGERTPTGTKVVAGAADVITSPIQASALAVVGIGAVTGSTMAKIEGHQYAAFEGILRRDPSIALTEHWEGKHDERTMVYCNSFSDPSIPYTPKLVEQIYRESPLMRGYLFASSACTTEFIKEHFDEAYRLATREDYSPLACMVSNPNTPLELIEKVASSKELLMGAVEPAREALKKRLRLAKPNQLPDPTSPPVTPPAGAGGAPSVAAYH